MASRMRFHFSLAPLEGQSLRTSSMELAKCSHKSGIDVLAAFIRGRPFCLEQWILFGWRRTLLPTRKSYVGVAVSAVVTACHEDTVKQGSPGDNKIQLVRVTRSWMSPGYSVAGLGGLKECVGHTKVVVEAQLQQPLPVLVQLANTRVVDAAWPELWSAPTRTLKSPSRKSFSVAGFSLAVVSTELFTKKTHLSTIQRFLFITRTKLHKKNEYKK